MDLVPQQLELYPGWTCERREQAVYAMYKAKIPYILMRHADTAAICGCVKRHASRIIPYIANAALILTASYCVTGSYMNAQFLNMTTFRYLGQLPRNVLFSSNLQGIKNNDATIMMHTAGNTCNPMDTSLLS